MNSKIILKLSTLLLLTSSYMFAESVGEASWYGEKFQGKPTASGEPFDMYDYTAAHRTYPFGTILKVTNIKNGKTIDVRVNDRGPHKKSRIVDLSYQAAKEIGIVESGLGEVRVEENVENLYPVDISESEEAELNRELVMEVVERKESASREVQVQIAAFSTKLNAESFVEDQPSDIVTKVVPVKLDGKRIYKVVVVYDSKEHAEKMVKSKKYKGAYILTQHI
jgi:rare lipoprotein A